MYHEMQLLHYLGECFAFIGLDPGDQTHQVSETGVAPDFSRLWIIDADALFYFVAMLEPADFDQFPIAELRIPARLCASCRAFPYSRRARSWFLVLTRPAVLLASAGFLAARRK